MQEAISNTLESHKGEMGQTKMREAEPAQDMMAEMTATPDMDAGNHK